MIKINNNAYITAYNDIIGIQRLIVNLRENQQFLTTHVYSVFRDMCLIIDEVYKSFITEQVVDVRIKHIRNQVHLYSMKRGYNQKIFNKILEYHIDAFGEKLNNIGFYLDSNKDPVGSTLYVSFVLLDTETLPKPREERSVDIRRKVLEFTSYVGELSGFLANEFERTLGIQKIDITKIKEEVLSIEEYDCKDINHNSLFVKDNNIRNAFITRLILSIQEISDTIFLKENYFDKLKNPNFMDYYILLRLVTLKTDEIFDNLYNLRDYCKEDFKHFNSSRLNRVSSLLYNYEETLKEEISNMRNMIHYNVITNNPEENFWGYFNKLIEEDELYPIKLIEQVLDMYLIPLKKDIIYYLGIEKINSLSDWEQIKIRLKEIFKH
ncbi:hypothetical protein WQ54_12620 [Bacillus sp. SA1-12]|uniref:hypothetical protein n=1 Tax=Bacillus sp. SA1-12 TaxID=1455638 RepID=UPI000626E3CA|nr:hypothetical protein [Bacillus sp. SA1-12]KKI91814.1 hypothetical protein WQ54_12620 [Bacillus sp. SA1-12]